MTQSKSRLRRLVRRIVQKLALSDAKHERGSERNGLFSYAGEVHAFLLGFAAGFSSATLDDPRIAGAVLAVSLGYKGYSSVLKRSGKRYNDEEAVNEIMTEPWYATGGAIAGYALGLVTVRTRL